VAAFAAPRSATSEAICREEEALMLTGGPS
jgi:hypothetical protein